MSKITVRNNKLRSLWLILFLVFFSLAIAANAGKIPFSYLFLGVELLIFALSIIFLYQWTIANHVQYQSQTLTLCDWEQGLYYSGLWGKTTNYKIPIQDIQKICLTDLDDIKDYLIKTKDQQLASQLLIPCHSEKSFRILLIRYLDSRIHLTNADSFTSFDLKRLCQQLKKQGVTVNHGCC